MATKRGKKGASAGQQIIVSNRKARHDYLIEDTLEAGIMLVGTEVKALREGKASLNDAYAAEKDGELWLFSAYIAEYSAGNRNNHETRRARKLLLHTREIGKLMGANQRSGMTLVPLSMYFNDKGLAKVELAIAKGKQLHDKRQSDKDKSWKLDKARLMREKN